MKFFVTTLTGLVAITPFASAAISNVCTDVSVSGGGDFPIYLKATCSNKVVGTINSFLNLDLCYAVTDNGIVYNTVNGGLQSACESCGLTGLASDLIMACDCKGADGTYQSMAHDLNSGTEIQDSSGVLMCSPHMGTIGTREAKPFVA